MKIVFRVDAALHIGSGHVMRCLTLADTLKQNGMNCVFICRDFPGHLGHLIEQRGYLVFLLTTINPNFTEKLNQRVPHAHWLGVSAKDDALATKDILQHHCQDVEYLIVDHYALDSEWESYFHSQIKKLAVIDDLADRQHQCDFLLDQTFGRRNEDYQMLVNPSAILLLGSRYALLRPEFLKHRNEALAHRLAHPSVKKILITMGGVDKDNCTDLVLTGLANSLLPTNCNIIIVLGEKAPHFADIKQKCQMMPWNIEVRSNITNMAELMTDCDFAIGAAGTTTWERCALGLPSIVITTATNQETIAHELAQQGIHWYIGDQATLNPDYITAAINHMIIDQSARGVLAKQSQKICDGKGTARVVKELLKSTVTMRLASKDDAIMLFEWRNSETVRKQSFDASEIPLASHLAWIDAKLSSDSTILLIAMVGDEPMSCVRYDISGALAEISIYLSPDYLGGGYGADVLIAAQNWLRENRKDVCVIEAKIKETNTASKWVFKKAQYILDYCAYRYSLRED